MSSIFPGMDPYLEYPVFWSSFHTRLMVAIAESLEPQLGTQYYVEVGSRTYQTDDNDQELLIGIPDAIVFSRSVDDASRKPVQSDREQSIVATQIRPEKVMIPMPVEVTERYLEVREMKSDRVLTVIELLLPKISCESLFLITFIELPLRRSNNILSTFYCIYKNRICLPIAT